MADAKELILTFIRRLENDIQAIYSDPTAARTAHAEEEDEESDGDDDSQPSLTLSSETDVSSDIENVRITSHNESPPALLPEIRDTIGKLFKLVATAAKFGLESAQFIQHDAPILADEDFLELKSSVTEIITKHFPALLERPGILGQIAESVARRRHRFVALKDQKHLFKTPQSYENWGVEYASTTAEVKKCGPCGSHELLDPLARWAKAHWR